MGLKRGCDSRRARVSPACFVFFCSCFRLRVFESQQDADHAARAFAVARRERAARRWLRRRDADAAAVLKSVARASLGPPVGVRAFSPSPLLACRVRSRVAECCGRIVGWALRVPRARNLGGAVLALLRSCCPRCVLELSMSRTRLARLGRASCAFRFPARFRSAFRQELAWSNTW